jgi:basic membrane protein A|tara:strand:+ start:1340 stop:2272 length:933 start_codon:yes stop_codon:yes gene_type:complete
MPVLSHAQADKLKVALVLPGSVTDGTFNSAAAEGIKKAQEKYPNLQVSIRENTQVAEAQEALSAYARDGYDIVIGHGFQFADPAKRIHKRFPDTWFIINTAKVAEAPNLASFDNRWGDAGYIAGAVAALLTESGKIGNIPAIPVPVIQEYDEGFKRGAARINPDIEVVSAFVGSFSDIAKAKEITTSMIDSGADVVSAIGNENVVGTLQAAKEKGVVMIGTAFDSAALAPDTIATTALINFDVNIDMAIGKVIEGTIEPKNYLLGLNENGIGLAPYRNFEDKLSAEDKAKVQEIMDGIRAGTIDDLPEIR